MQTGLQRPFVSNVFCTRPITLKSYWSLFLSLKPFFVGVSWDQVYFTALLLNFHLLNYIPSPYVSFNYLILVCLNSLKLFSKTTALWQNRKKNIACDLNVLMLNLQIILRKCERTSWNGKLRSEWLDNQTIALKPYPRGINLPENILVVWKASGTRYANAICYWLC